MLAVLALTSMALAAVAERWSDQAKRQRERELIRIGGLYAQAIASYYAASPGSLRQYPRDVKSLLEDPRMVGTLRHLRKPYPDPIDPSRPWGFIAAADGGIAGVYSTSTDAPLRTEPLDIGFAMLPAAQRYSDWKFVPKALP
jgi:type II secretory pathway pseudopilin PulG